MGVRTTSKPQVKGKGNLNHDGHLVKFFNSMLQDNTGATNPPPSAYSENNYGDGSDGNLNT